MKSEITSLFTIIFFIVIIYIVLKLKLRKNKGIGYLNINEATEFIKYELSNRGFEFFIAELFKELNYQSKVTKATGDEGRDVILNNGEIIIECKQFKTSVVGRDICFKLLGAMLYHKSKKCILVNTGRYSNNALEVERRIKELELWDLAMIKKQLNIIGKEKTNKIIKIALKKQLSEENLRIKANH